MPRLRIGLRAILAVGALASSGVALASVFPDVPDGHLYQEPIEQLVGAGIINGNPNGTFAPDRTVNRAEMLKMLYIASGRLPDPSSIRCFPDVEVGSWYEGYVCDAASRRFVQGYADGTFQPGHAVNRVEALKMIVEVLGIRVSDIGIEEREVVKFVDVSTSAWYTKYLYAAFLKGILPVAGQVGPRFNPEWPLLRGEAAAYVYNGLQVDIEEERAMEEADIMEERAEETSAVSRSSSAPPPVLTVSFPVNTSGKFAGRKPFSYRFSVDVPTTVSTLVRLQGGQPGSLSCRLYLLQESGFSDQYFLGFEQGNSCEMRTTLNPGSYQLQLQPTSADTTFTVEMQVTTGDGNDGFREAMKLTLGSARTETISGDDFHDWFTFTVTEEKSMVAELSNAAELRCIVYAMNDVDLFGFSGPECNKVYRYRPGTYFIAIGRGAQKGAKQTYTLKLVRR